MGGNGATLTRLKRNRILLPAKSYGDPDWTFMEEYMKIKEQLRINKYMEYINKTINELELPDIREKKWQEFFIKNIFTDIQRGKRLKSADHLHGDVPYISSSAILNGVDNFIGNNRKVRKFSNCLTLANSGSVGACFYQPYEFIASDHVTKLENKEFNKYIYLFISCIASRLEEKYSFNREINDKRIKKEIILLPVNENNQPDYVFIENYMKKIEYKQILKAIEYLMKIQEKNNKIVYKNVHEFSYVAESLDGSKHTSY